MMCRAHAASRCLANHVALWFRTRCRGFTLPCARRLRTDAVARLIARALKFAHRLGALCGALWATPARTSALGTQHATMWLSALHYAASEIRPIATGFTSWALAFWMALLVTHWSAAIVRTLRCAIIVPRHILMLRSLLSRRGVRCTICGGCLGSLSQPEKFCLILSSQAKKLCLITFVTSVLQLVRYI